MLGTCENCIFRKMHARPYNKVVMYKKKVLEYIHTNLWRLLPVLSVGVLATSC